MEAEILELKYEPIIHLTPTNKLQQVFLTRDKVSWLKMKLLEKDDKVAWSIKDFENVWLLKPQKKCQIKSRDTGSLHNCPRWSQSYLQPYYFSNLDHASAVQQMPPQAQSLLDYCRQNFQPKLNQSLINWYDKMGSISWHADDTTQLRHNSDIFSFSFGTAIRQFYLKGIGRYSDEPMYCVTIKHNTMLIMGGACQSTHVHQVPWDEQDGNRINVTFREMDKI